MGLKLRNASAKILALAFAGVLALVSPALAFPGPLCPPPSPTVIGVSGPFTFDFTTDQAFLIDDGVSNPVVFKGSGTPTIDVITDYNSTVTSSVTFNGSYESVCFDGVAGPVTLQI
ncbi:MAG: hypothetical protein ABIQ30_14390, partial [Devosia sp.]